VTDILTLDEARSHLLLVQGDTTRDDDIAGTYVPAVTPVVEDVVGPVVARALTHTADGGELACCCLTGRCRSSLSWRTEPP
jgi:hypothetical protein